MSDPSTGLHPAYRYVLEWVRERGGKSLDYGCGRGELVEAARASGIDMVGADVFHGGNDSGRVVREKAILGSIVFEMVDGRLPFGDGSFDSVVSNQVFEHVEDLDRALGEVARVLRPGGALLALFPSREVWREGHCGVPFAHWFPRQSRFRFAYILAMRTLGFGFRKGGMSRRAFAQMWSTYLDQFTHYRTEGELARLFAARFAAIERQEAAYLGWRLRERGAPRLARFVTLPGVRIASAWLARHLRHAVVTASR